MTEHIQREFTHIASLARAGRHESARAALDDLIDEYGRDAVEQAAKGLKVKVSRQSGQDMTPVVARLVRTVLSRS